MFKLFSNLKPYWKVAALAPLLMFIEVFSDIMQPTLMANIVDNGVATGNLTYIIKIGLLMIVLALIGMLGGMGCMITSSRASMNFSADVRSQVYKKIQEFSFANLDKFETSSLITRLTNDIVQVQNLVMLGLRLFVRAPLLIIGGVIMTIAINAKLARILLVAIPVLLVCMVFTITKAFPLFTIVQQKLDKVNLVIRENLSGVRVVKAFVRSDMEKSRFQAANNALTDITTKASRTMILIVPMMMLVMNFSIVAVIWFGGIQVNAGTMKVGQIIAFINYMVQILFSLQMFSMVIMNTSRAKASADRINEVLLTKVDIEDSSDSSEAPIKNGEVVFENVSFRYDGAEDEPVLSEISFTAKPNETIAILGATGSGKSTLVNLIPRLYDVTKGRILVDGKDVRNIKLNTLRKDISVVLQESLLFSGSIRDNICWGKEDASEEEVIEAAKAAQAHDFIMNFPKGYETQLGQRGVNISGGQKQRLAIARAIIKKPAILILDDSTSAVDMGTEFRIQSALKKIMIDCTTIVIAQRISTVIEADKILVLEDGKIVAEGRHSELLKTSLVYKDIYDSQIGEEAVVNA